MTNKYITKIASHGISDKVRDPDLARAAGKGFLYGSVGSAIGARGGGLTSLIGAVAGGYHGYKSSLKNQLKDQQLHDIKLQGAAQRQELHEAKMHKMAEEKDPRKGLKEAINVGTIAGLGGLATFGAAKATNKLLPVIAKKFPKVTHNGLLTGLGTIGGLAADYAGLKIGDATNKHIDKL